MTAPQPEPADVDLDLHGLVRVRLLGASPADAAAVERQLGPLRAVPAGEADIHVRFVDRLPLRPPVRLLGLGEAVFTDDDFVVVRGRGPSRARARFPFDRLGPGCEIVCESGGRRVPLLLPAVNLVMLAKGVLPLHASAFTFEGRGTLVTGWAKGGKTETLLGFMAAGAQYVGDEWVYLPDDGRMYGVPEPMRLWEWHLEDLEAYRRRLRPADRARLGAVGALSRLGAAAAAAAPTQIGRALNRVVPALDRQRFVHARPHDLFGPERCPLRGDLDTVVLVVSHEHDDVTATPAAPGEVARRMAASLESERHELVAAYQRFRFAFPEARCELLERAPALEADLLERRLGGRPAVVLRHPYPAPVPALVEALRPALAPR